MVVGIDIGEGSVLSVLLVIHWSKWPSKLIGLQYYDYGFKLFLQE